VELVTSGDKLLRPAHGDIAAAIPVSSALQHTYIHTYMHTYMHTCMYACMHTYIHTYIQR